MPCWCGRDECVCDGGGPVVDVAGSVLTAVLMLVASMGLVGMVTWSCAPSGVCAW